MKNSLFEKEKIQADLKRQVNHWKTLNLCIIKNIKL